jgi:DNA-binding transcriptional LysR family regulator
VALGRQCIAPAIPALLRRYPKLRLDLDLGDELVNLAQDGYDLAVRRSAGVWPVSRQ